MYNSDPSCLLLLVLARRVQVLKFHISTAYPNLRYSIVGSLDQGNNFLISAAGSQNLMQTEHA